MIPSPSPSASPSLTLLNLARDDDDDADDVEAVVAPPSKLFPLFFEIDSLNNTAEELPASLSSSLSSFNAAFN